ncbi:hypothetical protein E1B28_006082 [Marasmius oreades]|uniref:F-box domain-containing protein n=1 Tax=Marasmius oreades TaxID=181124 RepID=A0A9P7S577_9AGAR|nr:uncharacterized protein E1B28_006082 [Marasmius oreades]KAG7095317.1 hypothetical protein E1B28_006082 [Marasmius oreades]
MTMPFPSSPSLLPASHTHILYLILALWLSPVVAGMESTFRHHIWRHGIHSRPQKRTLPLPVDIVDLLLDTLHHDGKVLTLCSLVSRVWLLRTRPRMFSQGVVINRTKMARLLILLKSPYCTLRPHLQKMTIDPMRDNELWLDSFFTLIAAKGISLRHLTVPNLPALRTDSSCLSMPCIVPLISLHITVSPDHGVLETMDFIYLFSNSLENLAIRGHSATVPRPIFMGIAGRHQTFPRLQNLDIDGVQSLLQYIDWFSQFVVLSSLSSLYLGLDYCGSPLYDKNEISRRINIFLNRACPNVESLFLDYGWASPVSEGVNLSELYRLRALKINWTGGSPGDVFRAIDIIRTARASSLATVHVSNFDFGRPRKMVEKSTSAWSSLDDLLSTRRPPTFPLLRNVKVSPSRLLVYFPQSRQHGLLCDTGATDSPVRKFIWDNYIRLEY